MFFYLFLFSFLFYFVFSLAMEVLGESCFCFLSYPLVTPSLPPRTETPKHFLEPQTNQKIALYSFDLLRTIACPLSNQSTASLTISSTIAFALFFSLTTAAAFPIRNGRPLSMVSSSMSSPSVSKSCSTGMMPRLVRSLISCARFSSQSLIYGLLRTRSGRPYIRC